MDERASSLEVTRVPQVLVGLPIGANISGFDGVVFLVVGDIPIDNKTPVCDFVNLEYFSAQS